MYNANGMTFLTMFLPVKISQLSFKTIQPVASLVAPW